MRVAARSFIEAGLSLEREPIALPKDRVAAGALPLKTVYDLAAKGGSVYALIAKIYPESDSVYDSPAIDNAKELAK